MLRFICILAFFSSLARQQQSSQPPLLTLLKNTTGISEYMTLLTAQHTDLLDILASTPDTTLLIPTNDAFAKIPYSALGAPFLTNNSEVIRSVLEYHVLAGRYSTAGFNGTFRFLPTWLRNTSFELVEGGQVIGAVQQSEGVTILTSGLGSRATVNKSVSRPRSLCSTSRYGAVGPMKLEHLLTEWDVGFSFRQRFGSPRRHFSRSTGTALGYGFAVQRDSFRWRNL